MLHSHCPHFFHKWCPLLCTVLFPSALGACSFFCRVALCSALVSFLVMDSYVVSSLLLLPTQLQRSPLYACHFTAAQGYLKVEEVGQGQVRLQCYRYFQIALPPLSMGAPVLLSACPQTILANSVLF